MEWIEADPLPLSCQNCQEEDRYNCDHAGRRWSLSREAELKARRRSLLAAIGGLNRQIERIDQELASQKNGGNDHFW